MCFSIPVLHSYHIADNVDSGKAPYVDPRFLISERGGRLCDVCAERFRDAIPGCEGRDRESRFALKKYIVFGLIGVFESYR